MATYTTEDKIKAAYSALKEKHGYTNVMQSPKILKVVVSTGTGKITKGDKKKGEFIAGRLGVITGQKASARRAKQSIASFKSREGDIIGYAVTLRGARMNAFLEKLLNIAIPRTKDFRGFSKKAVDDMGNFTMGIKEHTIFPETADENLSDVFGLAITIVTNVKEKDKAADFLEAVGLPFRDLAVEKKVRSKLPTRGKKKK